VYNIRLDEIHVEALAILEHVEADIPVRDYVYGIHVLGWSPIKDLLQFNI
jgi:hypothetical protein